MTVPVSLATQLIVGASFALAGRTDGSPALALWRHHATQVAFLTLLLFEGLLWLPATTYLLYMAPDWGVMYVLDPSTTAWLWTLAPLGQLGLGSGTFVACAWAQRAGHAIFAWACAVLGGVGAGLLGVGGSARLSWVGSYAAFHLRPGELRSLAGSAIGWVMLGFVPCLLTAWAFGVWRVWLMSRAEGRIVPPLPRDASPPEISAQLLSVARPVGGRKP